LLTSDQKKYLKKIPISEKVVFFAYDPKTPEIVREIIFKIKNAIPGAKVYFMSASALGISGQGDIDISVLTSTKNYPKYLRKLKNLYGEPIPETSVIEWKFTKNKHEISIYLDDPEKTSIQKQIKVFNLLKKNKPLLEEYQRIKAKASNLSLREYQKAKYEFYNRILKNSNL